MDLNYVANNTFARVHQDLSRYLFIRGPVGSGKSSGCIWHILLNSFLQEPMWDGVRRSRYGIFRASYPALKSTVIKSWKHWFKSLLTIVYDVPIRGEIRMPHPDGETEVLIELVFIALDREEEVNKIQSLELTGAHLNEAAEIPRGVHQMLKSRVNRYPDSADGGAHMPFIIADYNSVPTDHWLYKIAEEEQPPKHGFYHQPSAMIMVRPGESEIIDLAGNCYISNPEADNLGSYRPGIESEPPTSISIWFSKIKEWFVPNLSLDYYEDQIYGAEADWVNVMILNNYGELRTGKPVYPEYIDSIHFDEKLLGPIKGIPIIIGMDLGLCYTDDTEVLTKVGWKFFKDVDVKTDLAATRNPITKELEYTKINFKVEEEHDGDMLEWDSQNVSFCVTPEHRVPFTYRDTPDTLMFESAEWLEKHSIGHHYIDVTSMWRGTKQKSPILNWSFKKYCQFMGWYLSEGSTEKNTNRVCITQKTRIGFFESDSNWVWSGCGYRCSNKELADHLKLFGNCYTKFVPQEIKDAKVKAIKKFIISFTAGDGYMRIRENGSEEHSLFTTSKRLADDFQELAQKVGWNSSLSTEPPSKSYYKKEGRWIAGVGGYTIRFKKRTQRAELLKRNMKRLHYKGKRYCLNVPYHTLYIRRNGRPSWNGNTPAATFSQLTPTGLFQTFDEIVTDDCSIRKFCTDFLKPHIQNNYRDHNFELIIDPACNIRSQNDAKAAAEIIKESGLPFRPARTNNPMKRREAIVYFLRKVNGFKIGPKCGYLRKGFISEYKFEKKRLAVANVRGDNSEMFKEKPDKNIYSHVHDAEQYAALEASEGKSAKKNQPRRPSRANQPADSDAGY